MEGSSPIQQPGQQPFTVQANAPAGKQGAFSLGGDPTGKVAASRLLPQGTASKKLVEHTAAKRSEEMSGSVRAAFKNIAATSPLKI